MYFRLYVQNWESALILSNWKLNCNTFMGPFWNYLLNYLPLKLRRTWYFQVWQWMWQFESITQVECEDIHIHIVMKLVHDTQSAQHAPSKEHNAYIVTSWRQSNAPIVLITTMALWRNALYGRLVKEPIACWALYWF